MDEAMLGPLATWWRAASEQSGEASALSSLCVQLARRSESEAALFLVNHALELAPSSLQALQLLEQLIPEAELPLLCQRYEAFLDEAPWSMHASAVRDRLTQLLFGFGHYYSALRHVDHTLDELAAEGPSAPEIERACARLAAEQSLPSFLERLDDALAHCEHFVLAEAAE